MHNRSMLDLLQSRSCILRRLAASGAGFDGLLILEQIRRVRCAG